MDDGANFRREIREYMEANDARRKEMVRDAKARIRLDRCALLIEQQAKRIEELEGVKRKQASDIKTLLSGDFDSDWLTP